MLCSRKVAVHKAARTVYAADHMRLDGDKPKTRRRVTVREAAEALGITVDAVRGRIKRGTLGHHKDPDGTVWVWLEPGLADESRLADDQPNGQPPDQALLVARLENEVEFLRDQVRRQQEIIAQQAVTMRQLTAAPSQEPTEDAETVEEEPEGAEFRATAEDPQEDPGAEQALREMAERPPHEGMAEERRSREAAERGRNETRIFGRGEAGESPETADEQQGRGRPHSATGGAQEGARRPWWRRVLGR